MSPLSITPPTKTSASPPGPKSAGPPPGATGDFAALLDQTSARTAPAEGPKNRPTQPESRRRDAAASKDDNKGNGAVDAQSAQSPPAAETGVAEGPLGQLQEATVDLAATAADPPAASSTAAAVAASAGTTAATTATASGTATADPAAAAVLAAAGTSTPGAAAASAATAVAGPATALPGSAGAASPGDLAATQADGVASQSTGSSALPGDGKLQIPAELLTARTGAGGDQAKDFKNGDQARRDLPPAPTLPPSADAAATPATASTPAPATTADPGAAALPAPSAPSAQAQPAAATPQAATVPVPSGAPQLSRASVLQTAERVQELVRIVATRAGTARAVLQLRPAELGQVDVHLRTTRNGLVATIAAHEQVGLDALHQAGTELRRTLEDKGVQLHSLDLQLGAGDNGFTNQGDAREASSGRRGAGAGASDSSGLGGDEPGAADELTITHASSTPAGALVDVQA